MISQSLAGALDNMNPTAQNAKLGTSLRLASAISAPNNVWFCDDDNGVDDKNEYGTSWDKAFKTVTYALTQAEDYDWIFLVGGSFDEGAVLTITQEGLKLIGNGIDNTNPCTILASAASHDCIHVEANNVEITGLGITQANDTKDGIVISSTAAKYKCYINNCRFDGYGQGEYGVKAGNTTYDAPDVVIENCKFQSWQTAAVYLNATRAMCRYNNIVTVAAKIGIELVPTTSNRGGAFIYKNNILGVNSTDTGIKITGTPDAGMYFIVENMLAGTATTITQKPNNAYCTINNYTSDAAGGALIDTVA